MDADAVSALVVNAATAENVAVGAGDAYAGEVCVGVGAGAVYAGEVCVGVGAGAVYDGKVCVGVGTGAVQHSWAQLPLIR